VRRIYFASLSEHACRPRRKWMSKGKSRRRASCRASRRPEREGEGCTKNGPAQMVRRLLPIVKGSSVAESRPVFGLCMAFGRPACRPCRTCHAFTSSGGERKTPTALTLWARSFSDLRGAPRGRLQHNSPLKRWRAQLPCLVSFHSQYRSNRTTAIPMSRIPAGYIFLTPMLILALDARDAITQTLII
jgi:hypothetical protein